MGRRIPGPPPGTEIVYVPKAFDNAKAEEPVRVVVRAPSERDRRAYLNDLIERVEYEAANGVPVLRDGAPVLHLDLAKADRQREVALKKLVIRIENYADAAGAPIATAEQFIAGAEGRFYVEVGDYTRALLGLQEEEKKTSDAPPSSPPAPSELPAADVAATDPTSSERPT